MLETDWGLTRLEGCAFSLGHLEVQCGPFPPGTRETIERAYEVADFRLLRGRIDGGGIHGRL